MKRIFVSLTFDRIAKLELTAGPIVQYHKDHLKGEQYPNHEFQNVSSMA